MPQINNLVDILKLFSWLFRLAATFPFQFATDNAGSTMLINSGLRNYGEMTVIFAIIFYGQKLRLNMIDPEDYVSYMALASACIIATMFALASVVLLVVRKVHVINGLNILTQVDTELKKLGVHVSYMFWVILCCLYISILMCIPIIFYFKNCSREKKILDIIAVDYSHLIRCGYIIYPLVGLGVVLERFMQLNGKLSELNDDDDDDDDDCSYSAIERKRKLLNVHAASCILDKITIMHASLIDTTKEISQVFSPIFLINIIYNIVQATQALIIIYVDNYEEIPASEMALCFFLNNAQVLALVLLSYFIEREAGNTLTTLGHLNICYFDQKLALKKNTLLLQGLQNKVNLNVCGMFPLNGTIFFKQFNVCRTLCLLIIQYYQKA